MSENDGMQQTSMPAGVKKPLEIAIALIAWLTAPAPTDWILTVLPSLIIPAIAPATEAGDDFEDTFRHSISSFVVFTFNSSFVDQNVNHLICFCLKYNYSKVEDHRFLKQR